MMNIIIKYNLERDVHELFIDGVYIQSGDKIDLDTLRHNLLKWYYNK